MKRTMKKTYRYPPTSEEGGNTYVFGVELVEEDDGRWSAGVPSLPGCATWGYTRDEALRNLRDAVEAYLRDMQKAGEKIPQDATVQVLKKPVVAITL
jgi:predicted RNase H-like HicB family nuclease